MLSISRDEDDAAALRADLKRSTLSNYKIQHCANLDDALHLMRVCGFDLVFVRLDDFQDKQSCVDLIRQTAPNQSIIALATSRLLAAPNFAAPTGLAATCRVEDLSPTLVATLITNTLERRAGELERQRREQELELALEVGQLGQWSLDIDSGILELDAATAFMLDLPSESARMPLDDALRHLYPDDIAPFKRSLAQAIDLEDGFAIAVRLRADNMPLPRLDIVGRLDSVGPQRMFGFVRRSQPTSELLERIANANAAVQKALDARDEAIQAAHRELQTLALNLKSHGAKYPPSPAEEPETAVAEEPSPAFAAEPAALAERKSPKPVVANEAPKAATPPPAVATPDPIARKASAPIDGVEPAPSLVIDKQAAFQNVLKSIARKQRENEAPESQDTFPFDFSASSVSDYSQPDPQFEGFVGAAKRLVSITQNGHNLRVSLNIEDDSMVEAEGEKHLLFDILRELLTNVVKHARASECIIALFRDEDDWVLQVEDDGVGLENNLVSISTPLNKIGLFRIRTRLAYKGGQLDLTPVLPSGLIARARLPVSLARHNHGQDHERA